MCNRFAIFEWLDNCGKMNAVERMRLRDVIDDVNGDSRARDTLDMMKKELRKR